MSIKKKDSKKEITFTDLAKYVFGFCMAKIIENSHKDDPLKRDIENLKDRCDQERNERLKAYRIWKSNRSEKNAVSLLNEIADEIIFLIFQAGKVAGFQKMERK